MRRLALVLALPLLAAPAMAQREDPLAGRVAGAAQQCLSLGRVRGPDIVDARTIVYRQNGRRLWVTHPVDDCPSLRPGFSTLIVDVASGDQLCRNDRFRVLSPNSIIPGPFCRFGVFTPYDRPARR